MEDKLEQLRTEAVAAFQNVEDEEQLEQARVEYLGRHGRLREAMKDIASLPEEQRPIPAAPAGACPAGSSPGGP